MIASLFEEVEQILAGDVLEEQKKEGGGFESAVKGDDVGVWRERLMNGNLEKRRCIYRHIEGEMKGPLITAQRGRPRRD